MSYKEKPQIKLYKYVNSQFELQAIIDDFLEVSFQHSLYEAGDFTISINYNIPNALLFQRGMFVQFGNNPYAFGEITKISDKVDENGKGGQLRTIIGKDARYIFKRRIIKSLNSTDTWSMTDKGELCLRNLIKDQCGSNAEEKRQLPIINTIPTSANAIGNEHSVSEAYTNLYDVLVTIATQSEIGWRVKFENGLILEVYQGNDISDSVQFSTDFDSLRNGEFTDTSDNFINAVYVGGKGQGKYRDIYEGESSIGNESPEGLERFECWDNQNAMTSEAEYETEALSLLSQYGQTVNVDGNGLAKSPYIFGEAYNVGDIITIGFSGKKAIVQILSVTEHWSWNRYDIEFSFGKPVNDLSRQLQLILRQIQKAKTDTVNSVKWYTMTSDVVQEKADIVYNTIGFTGAIGTGKTFTFFLDSEQTGAKKYNIYVKNLTGTGSVTLTTGVSGADNFLLNAGTYVTSIYIDEDGNVLGESIDVTDVVESGNEQPVSSGGVASALSDYLQTSDITDTVTSGSTAPVSSGGVYNAFSGHFLSLESPINIVTYAKIGIKNYDKKIHSVFIAFNCYTCWGVIREQNQCFYKGTLYGLRGVSYTGYSTDNNDYFWIKYSNYRSIDFVSSRELYVIEKTTTEPSGVSFIAPVSWDNNTRGEKSEEPIDEEKENER